MLQLIAVMLLSMVGCGGPSGGYQPIQQAGVGEPVYAVGKLRGKVASDYDFLRPAPYLLSDRSVEMYAFVDRSDQADSPGCVSEWIASPDLKIHETAACAGKRNRRSYVPNRKFQAELSILVDETEWKLQPGWTVQGIDEYAVQGEDIVENQRLKSHGGYFYFNQYCIDAAQSECERVRFLNYRFDPEARYVVVGVRGADGSSIEPFVDEQGERLYYIAPLAHLSKLEN